MVHNVELILNYVSQNLFRVVDVFKHKVVYSVKETLNNDTNKYEYHVVTKTMDKDAIKKMQYLQLTLISYRVVEIDEEHFVLSIFEDNLVY